MPVSLTFVSILGLFIMNVTNTKAVWTIPGLIREVIQSVGDPVSIEHGADVLAGQNFQGDRSMCEEAARRITAITKVTYKAIGNPDACHAYQMRRWPQEEVTTWNLVRCPGEPQEFFIRNYQLDIYVPQYTPLRRPAAGSSSC